MVSKRQTNVDSDTQRIQRDVQIVQQAASCTLPTIKIGEAACHAQRSARLFRLKSFARS